MRKLERASVRKLGLILAARRLLSINVSMYRSFKSPDLNAICCSSPDEREKSSAACLMLAARRLPSIDLYQNYVVIDFSVRSHMLRTTSVFEKQMRIGGSTCYSGASRLTTHDSHLTSHTSRF